MKVFPVKKENKKWMGKEICLHIPFMYKTSIIIKPLVEDKVLIGFSVDQLPISMTCMYKMMDFIKLWKRSKK